jgi:hypothetical protein
MSKIRQVGEIWQRFENGAISSHIETLANFRFSQKLETKMFSHSVFYADNSKNI